VGGQPATSSNVSITIPQQPTFGSVVVNPDGTIRFTPSPTFSGTGTFDVRVCSVTVPTNCVTSTITVQNPIVMTPITTPIVSGTNPTTIPVLPSITVGGQPATSSNVSITIPQQPTFGSVVVNPDGTIRFTPSPTFSGTGTFDVRVCSVSNPSNCVTSTITVQSPIVMTPITIPIVSGTNPTTIPVLPSITVGGQPATSSNVSITIPQQPTFGSVVVNPDGTIRFTPSPTFSGTGTFDVRVCSIIVPTNCVTSTITVQNPIVMTPITTPIVSGTNPTTIPVLPS
ncbi:MAG: Ig-like domain-containing protein, partial [Spirosomataceae bacterium]